MRRLSFCLLGTVTPSELIEDPNTTPFNIGRRIELNDFTEAEAATLARGLGRDEQTAARLMRRIYHWTGGQPYLTQSFCRAVAEAPQVVDATGVDRICQSLFFTGHARATDKNLQFVGGHLLNQEDQRRASLLDLYAKVHCGRAAIPDDETNPLCATLRLSGLVRVVDGRLRDRNRIYRRVFDREWVQANMPDAEKRRQRRAYRLGLLRASAVAAVLFAMAGAGLWWYLDGYVWDHVSYFNAYAKRRGMYEGVGPLSRADVAARAVSYKFLRKGRYMPVVRVEAVDSRGELNPRHGVGTYLRGAEEDPTPLLRRACQWEFVLDNQGRVVHEKALDKPVSSGSSELP